MAIRSDTKEFARGLAIFLPTVFLVGLGIVTLLFRAEQISKWLMELF